MSPSSLSFRVGGADDHDHETTGDHAHGGGPPRQSHPKQLKTKIRKDNDYYNRIEDGTDAEPLSLSKRDDQRDKLNDRDGSCGDDDNTSLSLSEGDAGLGEVEDIDVDEESSDTDEEDSEHVLVGFGERESPDDGFVVSAVSPSFECSELGVLRRAAVPARKYYGLYSPVSGYSSLLR